MFLICLELCSKSARQALPEKIRHSVNTVDAVPSNPTNASLLIVVTGALIVSLFDTPMLIYKKKI
jgi:hypothetical protein